MEKKPKIDYKEHETPEEGEFPNLSNVASANECTGLMYRTPADGKEWESLQELSPMEIPREENPQKFGHKTEEAGESKGKEEYRPRHLKT